jgi:hypothetical protein
MSSYRLECRIRDDNLFIPTRKCHGAEFQDLARAIAEQNLFRWNRIQFGQIACQQIGVFVRYRHARLNASVIAFKASGAGP